MEDWVTYVLPAVFLTFGLLVGWYRYKQIRHIWNKNQQNTTTVRTDQLQPQNEAPQSDFAEQSSINRERLQNSNIDPVNFTVPARTQAVPQTIIMMPKKSKLPKPSKAQNYNPKEKLPHFCKAPNDGDMIKRY